MFRHIVFDIDGTLIDTEKTTFESLHATILELMGEDRPHESLRRFFSIPSEKVSGVLGYPDPEVFLDTWNRKWDEMRNLICTFDGALELVRKAHDLGMTVGCVTSRTVPEFYEDELLKPVLDCFDVIILADDTLKHKPDPEPMFLFYEKVRNLTGSEVDPKECLFFGDTAADCGCCQSAGAVFALADWYERGEQGMKPDYLIRRPEQLEALFPKASL